MITFQPVLTEESRSKGNESLSVCFKDRGFLFEYKLTCFTDGVVLINKATALFLSEMLYIS